MCMWGYTFLTPYICIYTFVYIQNVIYIMGVCTLPPVRACLAQPPLSPLCWQPEHGQPGLGCAEPPAQAEPPVPAGHLPGTLFEGCPQVRAQLLRFPTILFNLSERFPAWCSAKLSPHFFSLHLFCPYCSFSDPFELL